MNVIKIKTKGFSLLELVIVLLILGLLIAGILGPLSTRIEQKERQTTQEILNDIKESLMGFAITNGRLPCPDTDTPADGVENRTGTTPNQSCDGVPSGTFYSTGSLPWVDIGVTEFDSWREHFTYVVTLDFADEPAGASNESVANRPNPCGSATVGVSFELCSGGNLDIVDAATGGNPVVNDIPAVVFSTGKHGTSLLSGDQSPDEQENTNGDNRFVYKDFSQASGAEFDDLMIWISPNTLKYRMVQAGRLP